VLEKRRSAAETLARNGVPRDNRFVVDYDFHFVESRNR